MAKKNPEVFSHLLIFDKKQINCLIHRKKGVRKLTIRIGREGEVKLTLPFSVSLEQGKAFLEEKKSWIFHHVSQVELKKARSLKNHFTACREVLYQGQRIPVKLETYPFLKKPKLIYRSWPVTENPYFSLNLPKDAHEEEIYQALISGMRKLAKIELSLFLNQIAKETGIVYQKLTVRDTVSRWGSCSAEGNISLSWRLILAPQEIARYVMIHELCHRKEPNHSPRFWAWVEQFFPDWKIARKWLKTQGSDLFGF